MLLASDTEGHEASRQGEVDRRFEQRALEEALQQRDREIQQACGRQQHSVGAASLLFDHLP